MENKKPMVYLAGKIEDNDWRMSKLNVHNVLYDNSSYERVVPDAWPVYPYEKFYYVGPFGFKGLCDVVGDHETFCDFDAMEHLGDFSGDIEKYDGDDVFGVSRKKLVKLCREAIKRADFVFAWIDCLTAYGTLFEIGYAVAIGKPVFIAGPYQADLWFSYSASTKYIESNDVVQAFETVLNDFGRVTRKKDTWKMERATQKQINYISILVNKHGPLGQSVLDSCIKDIQTDIPHWNYPEDCSKSEAGYIINSLIGLGNSRFYNKIKNEK